MIIDDLYVACFSFGPSETDAVSVVDANTVLPCAVARELLEAIAGGCAEVVRVSGGVDAVEEPSRFGVEF